MEIPRQIWRKLPSAKRSLEDIQSRKFWKAVVAELIGTFMVVFVGCAVCMDNWQQSEHSTTVQISLTFGLIIATTIWCFGRVSGGQVNPAITIAMFVTRRISLARAAFYIVAQCGGAMLGAGLLSLLHPDKHVTMDNLGNTFIQVPLNVYKGFAFEIIITFILVLTVFASCDTGRIDLHGSAPLAIGLSVTACHLFAIKYTGSSMNPARSFGPAVVTRQFKNHWVYWCGPILGGMIAGLLYEYLFACDATPQKIKQAFSQRSHPTNKLDTPLSCEASDDEKKVALVTDPQM